LTSLLSQQVLVLNRLWQPINICSARRAFCLLYLGHAQVVEAIETENDKHFYTHDMASWELLSSMQPQIEQRGKVGEIKGSPEEAELKMVRTVSQRLLIPQIIVLSEFDRIPKQEVKFTRENIFRRDSFTCQYCQKKFEASHLNLDHVIPRDKGGKSTWENVVCSCIRCNTRKANKLPQEAGMQLLKTPKAPRWRPLSTADSLKSGETRNSWSHFINIPRAEVELSS